MKSNKWLPICIALSLSVLAGCGQRNVIPQKTTTTAQPNGVNNLSGVSKHPPVGAAQKAHLESVKSPNRPHSQNDLLVQRNRNVRTGQASLHVPILEYHDTIAIPGDPYTMSPEQLDQEMAYLKSHGFHTVTLDAVYDAIHNHHPLPSRPIVLTFDDGYESNYTTATPILKKYGFVATEFMVSGFINKGGFLTAAQLRYMEDSHVWEIESHTATHPDLTKLSHAELWKQVSQPKSVLSQTLGAQINYFCYPFGSYNGNVIRDVERAGYLLAVCTNQGYATPSLDGPYLLNRIAVHQGLTITNYERLLTPSLG